MNEKKIMKEEENKFLHANLDSRINCSNHTRCTIAWRSCERHEDGSEDVEIAIAWCSPRDHFARKIGRHIAMTRLNESPMKIRVLDDSCEKCEFTTSPFSLRLLNAIRVSYKNPENRVKLSAPGWVLVINDNLSIW